MMEINSDELAELLEDEKTLYIELVDDDPDGIMIEWERDGNYDRMWICWIDDQRYAIDTYHAGAFLRTPDIGPGDTISVDELLDIVLPSPQPERTFEEIAISFDNTVADCDATIARIEQNIKQ